MDTTLEMKLLSVETELQEEVGSVRLLFFFSPFSLFPEDGITGGCSL